MSQVSDMIRKMFFEGDEIRDAGLTAPKEIERFDELVYGTIDPKLQSLDVYRLKGVEGKLPVLVSIHGGGWVYGDKERYQYYCMELARHGFAVVNFSYRLAPEYKYPAPFEDTNSVMQWVFDHADQYGLDTDHFFAVGDSAGANILSVYAAAVSDPEFAREFAFQIPKALHFTAIGLFCGSYLINMDEQGEMPTADLMRDFLPQQGSEKEIWTLSASKHITPKYPNTYFMTSNQDFLKDDNFLLCKALYENDVPFEFQYFGGKDKQLGHVFHLNIRSEEARRANQSLVFYFKNLMVDELREMY